MAIRPRTVLFGTLGMAILVFCIVQDRVTADGTRQYLEIQRAAAAGRAAPVTIDEIMRPAVRRSVEQGMAWSLVVMLAGAVAAGVLRGRSGGTA